MNKILNLSDIPHIKDAWKKEVFDDFVGVMLDEKAQFPCIFGVAGVKLQQVRYFFSDSCSDNPDVHNLAGALREYIPEARSYGLNTSFVVFFKPSNKKYNVQEYESHFWNILQNLNRCD